MDRMGFIRRTCIAGFCGCGFGTLALNAETVSRPDQDSGNQMTQQWLVKLLESLDQNLESAELKRIIKMSAGIHYDQLRMDDLLSGYTGRLNEFMGFLEKEWGWKVDYDEATGIITADENKTYCVCPVLDREVFPGSDVICYCSEGFAERMFSRVAGVEVSAEVVSSVRRGDLSCVYRFELPKQASEVPSK
jgi:hypothetical protein